MFLQLLSAYSKESGERERWVGGVRKVSDILGAEGGPGGSYLIVSVTPSVEARNLRHAYLQIAQLLLHGHSGPYP